MHSPCKRGRRTPILRRYLLKNALRPTPGCRHVRYFVSSSGCLSNRTHFLTAQMVPYRVHGSARDKGRPAWCHGRSQRHRDLSSVRAALALCPKLRKDGPAVICNRPLEPVAQLVATGDGRCLIEDVSKPIDYHAGKPRHRFQAPCAVEAQLVYAAVAGESLKGVAAHPAKAVLAADAHGKPSLAPERVVCQARRHVVQRGHERVGSGREDSE